MTDTSAYQTEDVILRGDQGPLLVCVHGLMGHISDFSPYADEWQKHFRVVIPNIAPKDVHKHGYGAEIDGERRLVYELSAAKIKNYLQENYPGEKAKFAGISLGGKICFDVAAKFPEVFAGACVTDVGLGALCESPLFDFLFSVLPELNLKQPWKALRKELKEKIPDQILRILVQHHIVYPEPGAPEAEWNQNTDDFGDLVRNSRLERQWDLLESIQAPIHVLKAPNLSAIRDEDVTRMESNPNFHMTELEGANHFIQINQIEEFRRLTVEYLK